MATDAPRLEPASQERVAEVWAIRAEAERSAHRRFQRIARELEAVGAPEVVVSLALRSAEDEGRHASLCEEVARAYGLSRALGEGPADHPDIPGDSPADRLVIELVGFCCIQETLNASLLLETLSHVVEPTTRSAVQALLADEVHHARLGWAVLAWGRATGHGARLEQYLPAMVRALNSEVLEAPDPPSSDSAALRAHGELPRSMRAAIYRAAMDEVILPGLEREGLDTTAMRTVLAGPAMASP